MRHIILALIALVAVGCLIPSITAEPAKPVLIPKLAQTAEPAENSLLTTPSMAAFLNDSWVPSTYTPDVFTSVSSQKVWNGTLKNATYANYEFLTNNSYMAPSATSPVYTAVSAGKDGLVKWTGESIYQFLDNGWTPDTPVEVIPTGAYKKHQMS